MFKHYSDKELSVKQRRNTEHLLARQSSMEVANAITFVVLAENGTIDDVTAGEHTDLFSPWEVGITYKAGDMRQYDNSLYRCVQAHTSQEDWTPDAAVSLWARVSDPTVEFPDWAQPVGAHDAYDTGDKVTCDGKRWISTVDGNVWRPGVYGWEEYSE